MEDISLDLTLSVDFFNLYDISYIRYISRANNLCWFLYDISYTRYLSRANTLC